MTDTTTIARAREIINATRDSLLADCTNGRIYMGNGNAVAGQRSLGATRKGSPRDSLRREYGNYRFGNLSISRAVSDEIATVEEFQQLARDGYLALNADRMRKLSSFYLRREHRAHRISPTPRR